ncbi:MAG: hypothetical protein M1820_000712 [Bogoriella megaspora]|nr:MAG: hypothetical protein M1820_000712 [Bogoriella megaspora]
MAHYGVLRQRASNSSVAGRANPSNEKVFIVSSIYDPNGALTGGAWGQTVLDLIDILGPTNVFLSVYENDPSELAEASLDDFRRAVHCNASVISEHISMDSLPKATLPSGEERVRRIAFLAEVRNRALRPLDDENSPASKTQFDKLLFLNDVIFNPVEAAQLLFSTNVDAAGKADYRAACAVDFINPFKFYDTYATRDLEGYGVGLPFYPWFSSEGDAASRRDVLAQKDAVRVRSCWGGMVAFDAKWFQQIPRPSKSAISTTTSKTPLRFTYDHELYWDSSECCLINAQLQTLDPSSLADSETGIFMNPFVRVAYDENTFRWLPLVRRIERTFSWIHGVLTSIIGVRFNYRRTEEPGDAVSHYEWDPANDASKKSSFEMRNDMDSVSGNWKLVQTTAGVGGFCGIEQMLLLGDGEDGHPRWENAWMPEKPLLARLPVPQI